LAARLMINHHIVYAQVGSWSQVSMISEREEESGWFLVEDISICIYTHM
jgi:hypothetical protein